MGDEDCLASKSDWMLIWNSALGDSVQGAVLNPPLRLLLDTEEPLFSSCERNRSGGGYRVP